MALHSSSPLGFGPRRGGRGRPETSSHGEEGGVAHLTQSLGGGGLAHRAGASQGARRLGGGGRKRAAGENTPFPSFLQLSLKVREAST